ncbi:MAG: carbon monoxide dehydrogenase [Magnetovibrio sp.]|nr:carbon monoxide dehydrogenase [Magnetovibrio sp.]|tara:strand:- start:971 stop:1441 length:471 start_codon:yes stop_codon:yes gene_type:complete
MTTVSMTVNGKVVTHEVKNHTLLIDFIRETLDLTGTHVGCDTSQCGTCTIHVNNMSVKACTMLALQAEGAEILTIEGVANANVLHPMQQAFAQNHGLQCGFCTPGMIMTALALIKDNPNPTEEEVRLELDGNLCRCTGYQNIVTAILEGARAMRAQ